MLLDLTGKQPVVPSAELYVALGIDRWARKRALDAMEAAGIIRTDRARGRLPRIWLLRGPDCRRVN
jgi:hypothetical protein